MWASPWWLWFVDSVWCDTYDGTAPAIVPSPNGFDGATTSRDGLLRRRIRENPGFDPAAYETLGVYLDPTLAIDPPTFLDNWQDNAMMVAGRGNRLLTFYMNPAAFPNPSKDWPFLADLIRWTRFNAPTLAQTQLILGDPYLREPYGYAHFLGRRGILTLRNPFIQSQKVQVKLDASSGWRANEAGSGLYQASLVFPYRKTLRQTIRYKDTIELDLAPYQTLILEIAALEKDSLTLPGVRSRELSRSPNKIVWEVFGLPRTTLSVPLTSLFQSGKITQDGHPARPTGRGQAKELSIPLPGGKPRL